MSDERFRGVQLNDKQLVFAFMAATVVLVAVFLCGVLVGRGVRTARGPAQDDGTIASSQVVADAGAAEAPLADGADTPVRESGADAGATGFTYPARLGSHPPVERLEEVPAPDLPRARPEPPPDVPAEPVAEPSPSAADAPGPTRPPGAAGAGAPNAAAPDAGTPGAYTVQVAAVRNRAEADAIVRQLKAKGFDARVLAPGARDNPAVFRVRIGSFKDKRAADALAERLKREEKRYQPWVTR
ncbi:MAG TPA: SPOR domain-containing protein [Vicinamibacterales bacterium]|nr:SPOR domain-containing protein [Vicinamibacterales bacterium]